ncbi:MAG: PilZ domain-containing protein [Acidobacteriota bacterium]|nr:PilZ domain-containing protein [Acidobacteriota bacterium]
MPTSLSVEWGLSQKYQYHGKITSLSAGGCLLATSSVQPLYGKTIYIRVPLPDQEWWEVRGEVLYYVREVGFGVQFFDMTDDDRSTLRLLMHHYRENPPDNSRRPSAD